MTPNDVITFAMENPVSWIATSEDSQPHVRGMMMWFADKTGFYYHTASCKQLHQQISKNPKTELAFFNPGEHQGDSRMMRVVGTAEFVNDEALLQRLFTERPWLNDLKANMPDGTNVAIIRISNATAHFWDMTVNGREAAQPRITIA